MEIIVLLTTVLKQPSFCREIDNFKRAWDSRLSPQSTLGYQINAQDGINMQDGKNLQSRESMET